MCQTICVSHIINWFRCIIIIYRIIGIFHRVIDIMKIVYLIVWIKSKYYMFIYGITFEWVYIVIVRLNADIRMLVYIILNLNFISTIFLLVLLWLLWWLLFVQLKSRISNLILRISFRKIICIFSRYRR